jgi:integrase
MVVEKLSSALMFGAVRGAAQIVQKLEAARPLSAMAMDMVMRRIGESVTMHGFRSSFHDWAGNETHFPRELAEAALAHVVGDKAEQAYRRSDALEKRRALMEAWAQWCEPREAADNVTPVAAEG